MVRLIDGLINDAAIRQGMGWGGDEDVNIPSPLLYRFFPPFTTHPPTHLVSVGAHGDAESAGKAEVGQLQLALAVD